MRFWRLPTPDGPHRTGLIPGIRRLCAHHAVTALSQNGDFTTSAAFIRTPASLAQALTPMIEENKPRPDLSPWEKARSLVPNRNEGAFATIDAATLALHPNAIASERPPAHACIGGRGY